MIEDLPGTRVLFKFFGDLVQLFEDEFTDLRHDLRAARMAHLYRSYVARTLLYSVFSAVVVVGVLVGLGLQYLRTETLRTLPAAILIVGFTFPGLAVGYLTYRVRLYYPRYVANRRATAIELSMPDVINFMLALSRGRVPTPRVLEQVASYSNVLGPAAKEVVYASRHVEYFRADVVSALKDLAETTPSDEFSEFIENYVNLLASRGDVSEYLDEQMQAFFDEAELQQEEFLTTLGLLAETYVALFVAGPLFGIILLVVMGFLGGDVLMALRIGTYLFIPLTAIGYLIVLDSTMENPLIGRGEHQAFEIDDLGRRHTTDVREADPTDLNRMRRNLERLGTYAQREAIRTRLNSPLTMLRNDPRIAMYVGIVLGIGYMVFRLGVGFAVPGSPIGITLPQGETATGVLRAIDNSLIEALMVALAVYIVFFERRWRYLMRIERTLPSFLQTLSDRYQRGISLSRALTSLEGIDLGAMNVEIERMVRDIRLNASATEALKRFANRVKSPRITRMIILLTTATETSQRIGPVVETLATSAELKRRLDRKREVEMMLYVVIIYVAFFVFILVLAILNNVFLPQMPQQGIQGATQAVGGFDPSGIQTIFYHASVIQGLFSGLVAGKMSEARASAGAKHALLMVAIAYVTFTIVLPAISIQL